MYDIQKEKHIPLHRVTNLIRVRAEDVHRLPEAPEVPDLHQLVAAARRELKVVVARDGFVGGVESADRTHGDVGDPRRVRGNVGHLLTAQTLHSIQRKRES